MYLSHYIFYISFFLISCLFSQSNKVISGPMLSYIDGYSTQIWFLLDSEVKTVEIDIRDYENDKLLEYDFDVINPHDLDEVPLTIQLETLLPNKEYIMSVVVDGVFIKEMDLFTKRPHLDDLQFLISSDLGNPSPDIFSHMSNTHSDFMVWLGGHVSSDGAIDLNNIISSYTDVRKDAKLNHFMSSTPQISTWGELDYGLDINAPFSLKKTTYNAFEMFWPNSLKKTYNYTFFDYGTYQRYTYNDVDLFLLDAMTFRTEDKSVCYGDKQIERMFQEMQNTGATFTIIASPLPFTFDTEDAFLNYQREFNHFLYRLEMSDLDGIVLISAGGEISTAMNTYTWSDEITNKELSISEFNFCPLNMDTYSLINVSGKAGYRVFSFETYNENGTLVYGKKLYQNQLKLH